jgi:hypothetical protein
LIAPAVIRAEAKMIFNVFFMSLPLVSGPDVPARPSI